MLVPFAGILGTAVYFLCSQVNAADDSGVIFDNDDEPVCPAESPDCTEVAKCPSAIASIKRGEQPIICGWLGTTALVCCAVEARAVTEPRRETVTRSPLVPLTQPSTATTEEVEETPEGIPPDSGVTTTEEAEEIPEDVRAPTSVGNGHDATQSRDPDVVDGVSECGVRPRQSHIEDSRRDEGSLLGQAERPTGNSEKPARGHFASEVYEEQGETNIRDNWPWVVFLEDNRLPARECVGVLLDKRHVLTAAQCLSADFRDNVVVKMNLPGESSVRRLLGGAMHPAYTYPDGYGDVAMVEFTPPLRPHQLTPICLPKVISERRSFHGKLLTVVDGLEPSSMTEQQYRVIRTDRCNATYVGVPLSPFPKGIDEEEFLCAERNQSANNKCSGVPGSPLMELERGVWTVVGIYNFGVGCFGSSAYPTVFTKISPFVTWIYEYLGL